jgi:hypothetical protein
MAYSTLFYTEIKREESPAFLNGRAALYPLLSISLLCNGKQIDCVGLVDSGAEYCVFPGKFLDTFGIDRTITPFEESVKTPAGKAGAYFHEATIQLASPDSDSNTPSWPIYAGFAECLDDWAKDDAGVSLAILGQVGFFDRFRITFNWRGRHFELEDYYE